MSLKHQRCFSSCEGARVAIRLVRIDRSVAESQLLDTSARRRLEHGAQQRNHTASPPPARIAFSSLASHQSYTDICSKPGPEIVHFHDFRLLFHTKPI